MSARPDPLLALGEFCSFAKTRHIRDHCLCLRLQRAARVVARRFDDALRAIDLTQGQFSLRRVSAGWGSENNQVPPANHASPSSLHPKRIRGVGRSLMISPVRNFCSSATARVAAAKERKPVNTEAYLNAMTPSTTRK
jgi:hypothetical protein